MQLITNMLNLPTEVFIEVPQFLLSLISHIEVDPFTGEIMRLILTVLLDASQKGRADFIMQMINALQNEMDFIEECLDLDDSVSKPAEILLSCLQSIQETVE